MKENQKGVADIVFILVIVVLLGIIGRSVFQNSRSKQETSSIAGQTDEEIITNLFKDSLPESGLPLEENEEFRIEGIETLGEWAFIKATLIDSDSGKPFVGELTFFLFRKVNHEWAIAFPGTDLYKNWLEEFPETLLPSNIKTFLR